MCILIQRRLGRAVESPSREYQYFEPRSARMEVLLLEHLKEHEMAQLIVEHSLRHAVARLHQLVTPPLHPRTQSISSKPVLSHVPYRQAPGDDDKYSNDDSILYQQEHH